MPIAHTFWNRRIKVHDGIEIAADILLPQGEGPFPTVVIRTPYMRGANLSNSRSWVRLIEHGYALVAVDLRGRGDSQGKWTTWLKDPRDGHDVIEWVAAQPWCSGKIGMVGGSYEGLTQWWTVAGRPKHLTCIAPMAVGGLQSALSSYGTGIASQYRIWTAALTFGRTQQYPGAPSWDAWIDHTPLKTLDECFGLSRSVWKQFVAGEVEFGGDAGTLSAQEFANVDIPVLIGVGWWDDQQTMRAWQALQAAPAAPECRLLIGAWDHAGNVAPRRVLGGVDVSESVMDTIAYVERFLALHLKGESNELASKPRCRVFTTGDNRWEELPEWPHPQAVETAWYLTSEGDARGLHGTGRLVKVSEPRHGSDTYVYDPNVPTRDMSSFGALVWADPPLDHRYLQRRLDTLVYTSDVLKEALKLSGQYRLRVYVSCDRPDSDLFVMLSDVHPDGRAIGLAPTNILSACLRLRYRNGPAPQPLEPGRIYEISLAGTWIHHVFKKGHRLRITISSSNFPLMARNAGTGEHWAADEVLYPQTNTIHHSAAYPSRVLLPVVPNETH